MVAPLLAAVAAALVGVAVAVVVLLRALGHRARSDAAAEREATVRDAVEAAARIATSERDATVREAVESAVRVAGGHLEASLAGASRDVDARNQAIHRQMTDMAAHLRQVGELVGSLQADRARQHGELVTRISEAQEVTKVLAGTTEGLHRALASPQARGQWGERMAEDVLRAAGFVEGVNYAKQRTLADGSRPDLTFLLPDDRLLHMDVKFPVAGYLRWQEADTDTERRSALTGFLRDVRARVRELGRPGYADETTVGFVLLFLPNESVYGFLHAHDPKLADEALSQRVVLCSPFTLFAVLGVIRQACDSFMLERSADEILAVLGGFTGQWERFTERLDALGKHLQTAQNSYDQLAGTRRRALEKQLGKVEAIRQARGIDTLGTADDDGWDAEVRPLRGTG